MEAVATPLPLIRTPSGLPDRPRALSAGFTLVEILAAVVVLGIVASIAAPRVRTMAQAIQVDAAARQVAADLERARTEAIKRNASVKVTAGTSGYTIQYIGARDLDGARFISAPDSVKFAPFGPPSLGGASYIVAVGDHARTVTLDAGGHVEVR